MDNPLTGGGEPRSLRYVTMADGMKEAKKLRYLRAFVSPGHDVGCTMIYEGKLLH